MSDTHLATETALSPANLEEVVMPEKLAEPEPENNDIVSEH